MKKSPIIKKIPVSKADAILLKVPYEGTVSGGKGAAGGPRAIVEMLEYQVEMFDYLLKKTVCDEIGIIQKEVGAGNLKPEKLVEKVQRETLKFFGNEKFLVMLGGEHTVSLGAISAAKKIFGNLTVIQIDAHADMRNDNSDYEDDRKKITKHAHSCVMRRAWELGCDIVPVGIRSLSPMEHEFIGKEKLEKNIFYTPVKASYKEILSRCRNENVYLTVDADGYDPAVMPATGTPEPGGLGWDWTLGLFKELFREKNVIGMDVVEVAPRKCDTITEFAAAKLVYHLIGRKFL